MHSWISIDKDSDFSIYNIPFGIYSQNGAQKRVCTAIGESILDLAMLHDMGLWKDLSIERSIWTQDVLNPFIGLGKQVTNTVRERIQNTLADVDSPLKGNPKALIPMEEVQLHLPVSIGDYTDFYSSIEHATNVGKMFRDPDNALLPNWKHLPVGYHGRASSVIVSGVNIHRPKGQTKPNEGAPVYGATKRLDFELEMAFVIGKNSDLGTSISTEEADSYIFGMVLFNDWSARDIQKWEYVPLGPFLGKSFASSMSPWIVTTEALDFARVAGPVQDPDVLPYLKYSGDQNYDIRLSLGLTPKSGEETIICQTNFRYMYWNMLQQLAHHTVNGCNVNIGDLMASGTISGSEAGSYGSLLELSWGGKREVQLKNDQTRKFLEDYDIVTIYGHAKKGDRRVGFGEVSAEILPSK